MRLICQTRCGKTHAVNDDDRVDSPRWHEQRCEWVDLAVETAVEQAQLGLVAVLVATLVDATERVRNGRDVKALVRLLGVEGRVDRLLVMKG